MLTPRRIFVLFVLVIVSLLAGGNLAKLRLHLPRFPSQLLNSTNFSARPTSQLDQPSPSHVADLEQPSTRPDLVPKISGPAVELYTPPGPQTYPRVIKLRSGNLLAVLATYEPENTIALSISQDQGISWHPYGFVATAQASNIQVGNAFLLELPSTRLLAAYRRHTLKQEAVGVEEKPGGQNEGYLYYKLMIYFSDDVGKTWHYLSTPVQGPGPRHGLWEPFLRLANNGSLQLFYSQEEGGRDQDNLMRVSSDGGKTWSGQIFVSGQDMATRDGMMGIQELEVGSGVLMAVFESVEEKAEEGHFEARFEVWCSISRDDGNTWGERRMIYDGWWNEPVEHSLSTFPKFFEFGYSGC